MFHVRSFIFLFLSFINVSFPLLFFRFFLSNIFYPSSCFHTSLYKLRSGITPQFSFFLSLSVHLSILLTLLIIVLSLSFAPLLLFPLFPFSPFIPIGNVSSTRFFASYTSLITPPSFSTPSCLPTFSFQY